MAKCYMCDNESTSVEHTPPRGFFPVGLRTNLITVPACKIHNEDTSQDDEYVRNILTMSIENNDTAITHFFDKSLKSLQRSPGLAANIRNSLKEVSFYKLDAHSFQIDRRRFDRNIRKIAYSLFYHEYGYTWERLLAVTTNQLKMPNMTNDHLGDMFDDLVEDLDTLTFKGENPLVFKYALLDFGENRFEKAIFMLFYEGFPFWIIPDKTSTHNDFD